MRAILGTERRLYLMVVGLLVAILSRSAHAGSYRHDNRFDVFSVATLASAHVMSPQVALPPPGAAHDFQWQSTRSPASVPYGPLGGYSGSGPYYSGMPMPGDENGIFEVMRNDYNNRINGYGTPTYSYQSPSQELMTGLLGAMGGGNNPGSVGRSSYGPSYGSNFGGNNSSGTGTTNPGGQNGNFQLADGTCQSVRQDPAMIAQVKQYIRQNKMTCNSTIPSSPKKVVFGFAGLGNELMPWMPATIKGMTGGVNSNQMDFEYYSHNAIDASTLTQPVVCAYQMATRPYHNAAGQTVYNSMNIVGHSFGGDAAHRLAVMLGRLGVTVDTVVTADARQPYTMANQPNWGKPCNVARWDNYYETAGGMNLPGFRIPGTNNLEVGGNHMTIPSDPNLQADTFKLLTQSPTCKANPGEDVFAGPGGGCSGATPGAAAPIRTAVLPDVESAGR